MIRQEVAQIPSMDRRAKDLCVPWIFQGFPRSPQWNGREDGKDFQQAMGCAALPQPVPAGEEGLAVMPMGARGGEDGTLLISGGLRQLACLQGRPLRSRDRKGTSHVLTTR